MRFLSAQSDWFAYVVPTDKAADHLKKVECLFRRHITSELDFYLKQGLPYMLHPVSLIQPGKVFLLKYCYNSIFPVYLWGLVN